MTENEQDIFYKELLPLLLEDATDSLKSIQAYTLTEYKDIKKDFENIISSLQFLIENTNSIDDLADQDDEIIDAFYESLFDYTSNFCVSESPSQKEIDLEQYNKLEEILMLFMEE